jgi:hypothetical protein
MFDTDNQITLCVLTEHSTALRNFLEVSCGAIKYNCSGFGGLVVSMLASGTQDHRFKPGRSRQNFSGVKILSMPSFGREVTQFVSCRRFAARKRTLLDYVEVGSLRPNYSDISCSKFPPSLTGGSSDRVGSGLSVEVPLYSSGVGALWN